MFVSRADSLGVLKIDSPDNIPISIKIKLSQLPEEDSETNSDIEDEFVGNELIEEVTSSVNEDGSMLYTTIFKKKWDGSLKGYLVDTKVISEGGVITQ